ncbi:MAG TPA: phosphoenolpyruvate carboxykinase (ATP), partial [Anaerolineales bacterium]|nr:phosphoenolpyruvate carboxykinase (ATP) [Anaerolineales bacterium]
MPAKRTQKKTVVQKSRAKKSAGKPGSAHRPTKPEVLDLGKGFANLSVPEIYEHAIRGGAVQLTAAGSFNAITTPHTGRSPLDKFVVREPASENDVRWGKINQPIDEAAFDKLQQKVMAYLNKQPARYTRDVFACADPGYRMAVRFVSESAWHMLFINNLFIRPTAEELKDFTPQFTVLHAPELQADPKKDGVRSGTFIVLHLTKKIALIGGTRYAGELKKSIFTALNYLLPKQGVLSMHCSCNVGEDRSTALFFGLSGTGKTTLSADPSRALIGDDEHGWSDSGVFNLEGGCYAKVIKLSKEAEPDIWKASHRFGAVLENVVLNPDRTLDLESEAITENTRAAYPIYFNQNTDADGVGGHPNHVVFLTADAYG